jgi:cephalosporin-C deacetylase-like acetyl esterase
MLRLMALTTKNRNPNIEILNSNPHPLPLSQWERGENIKHYPFLICVFYIVYFIFYFCSKASAFQTENLKQLWDIPTGEVKAVTAKTYYQGKIKVEEIYYFSRQYHDKPVKIFGYFCYPASKEKLPAILLSHGGGGTASLDRAVNWAARGYAVLAIDLPGKGENRAGSRSTGPDMTVPILLETKSLSDNYLIHAAAAARNGITYLTQRKEVDPERIGMIGLSWGGVLTILTNGQDERLKAAVNVFGAGYISEGCAWQAWFTAMSTAEKSDWDNYVDPKNFLATQKAPILFVSGTNDHCYYLPTFQKSFLAVTAEKNLSLIANGRHKFLSAYQNPALAWLDQKLKTGGSFPKITLLPPFAKGAGKVVIPVTLEAKNELNKVFLNYAAGGPTQWTIKSWKTILPFEQGGVYYFSIPTDLIAPEIIFYVTVKDNKNGLSSSPIQSLFALQLSNGTTTYALSSPLLATYQHTRPLQLLNGMNEANLKISYLKKENIYRADPITASQ